MMALAAVFPLGIDGHHVHRSQFPVVCQVTRARDRGREKPEGRMKSRAGYCLQIFGFIDLMLKIFTVCVEKKLIM